jgi:hypothetical protein
LKADGLFPRNFLHKDDIPQDTTVNIEGIEARELDKDDGSTETKYVLILGGGLKPLVINRTNSNTIVEMYGGETDGWVGKPITLYVDVTIQMKGKVVGGIRIRTGGNGAVPTGLPVISPEKASELFKMGREMNWPKPAIQRLVSEIAGVDSMSLIQPQFVASLEKHLSLEYKEGAETDVVADDIPF